MKIESTKLDAYRMAASGAERIEYLVPCSGLYCGRKVRIGRNELISAFESGDYKACMCSKCEEQDGQGAGVVEFYRACPKIFLSGSTKTDAFKFPKAWHKINKWTLNDGLDGKPSIYIYGATGACKSRMLFTLLWDSVVKKSVRMDILRGGELRTRMLSAYEESMNAATEYISKLANVPLLAFDDFGQDVLTERMFAELWRLIDARFSDGLPTIFLSNYSIKEMRAKLISRQASADNAASLIRRIEEFSTIINV